jgi:hypothetical protein
MSAKKSGTKEDGTRETPLMMEDTRLKRKYSVMEIATLAAGCRGETPKDRIEDAIQLLSAVEWHAVTHKLEKLRERIRLGMAARGETQPTPEHIDSTANVINKSAKEFDRWIEIRDAAKRDEATGKIVLHSLTLEICKAAGVGNTVENARLKYNEWLASELIEQNEYASSYGLEAVSLEDYKSLHASNDKRRLIHDDMTASLIIDGFLWWLEKRPKKPRTEILHSHKEDTKGQIVSPETRGADRGEDGKFTT